MAGNVFVICMLSVSGLGAYLAFRKSEADNVLGGIFTFYLVATAWATARRGEAESWKLEWTTPPVALAVAAAWFFWGVEVTRGRMAVEGQSSAGGYFFFGVLALLCAAGDVRMLLRGHLSGAQRLVRHLWRMCFGWFIATISFFLGQPQVFPTWLRRSHVLVGLAFLPLLFLIFWFIRVRFTKTYKKDGGDMARPHRCPDVRRKTLWRAGAQAALRRPRSWPVDDKSPNHSSSETDYVRKADLSVVTVS
jgi:hypothetical protein